MRGGELRRLQRLNECPGCAFVPKDLFSIGMIHVAPRQLPLQERRESIHFPCQLIAIRPVNAPQFIKQRPQQRFKQRTGERKCISNRREAVRPSQRAVHRHSRLTHHGGQSRLLDRGEHVAGKAGHATPQHRSCECRVERHVAERALKVGHRHDQAVLGMASADRARAICSRIPSVRSKCHVDSWNSNVTPRRFWLLGATNDRRSHTASGTPPVCESV